MTTLTATRSAGTWTGVGIFLAEAVGFHPLGMLVGVGIAAGSRWLGAGARARR